jgi:DNA polymerase
MSGALEELAALVADLSDHLAAEQARGVTALPGSPPAQRAAPPARDRQPRREPPRQAQRGGRPERTPSRPSAERQPRRQPAAPKHAAAKPSTSKAAGLGQWGKLTQPTRPAVTYGLDQVVGAWGFPQTELPALAPGSPARAAADRLLAVRTDLGDCRRCGLCSDRNKLVFGMGDPGADLVLVGEGPGANEDRRGLPFVGASGEMLDKMLQHVLGLRRNQVYILNIVKCRPPANRTPQPDEIEACRPFLDAQLRAIAPKVILGLGSTANKALLQTSRGIMALRGNWQTWHDVPVMPTFHPAYLLRRPADKAKTFHDLKALRARYDELGGRR